MGHSHHLSSLGAGPLAAAPVRAAGWLCIGSSRKGVQRGDVLQGQPQVSSEHITQSATVYQDPSPEGQRVKGQGGVGVKSVARWRWLRSVPPDEQSWS